jgi:hypothetical protein
MQNGGLRQCPAARLNHDVAKIRVPAIGSIAAPVYLRIRPEPVTRSSVSIMQASHLCDALWAWAWAYRQREFQNRLFF